jgi:hypothetical protein
MKKIFILLLLLIFFKCSYTQLALSLKMRSYETVGHIPAASNKNLWAITLDFSIYNASNKIRDVNEIHTHELLKDISVFHLQNVDVAAALLSVNTIFENNNYRIVYKTTNTNYYWNQAFVHWENIDVKPGIFNENGLSNYNFSSFSDSLKTCRQLCCTKACMLSKSFYTQHKT